MLLCSGDAAGLLADVAELRPHMFMSVPRIYNKLHDAVMGGVKDAGPQQQRLFQAAYEHRKAALQAGGALGRALVCEVAQMTSKDPTAITALKAWQTVMAASVVL